jgi:hypothetical protein
MKTYVLVTIFYLLITFFVSGEIINGYRKDIQTARASLNNLTALPQDRNVKTRVERAQQFISYFELTEKLLGQFKTMVPVLYNQIDTLRDHTGRPVDVYVKFVPKSEIQTGTLATTNIDQLANDKHGCYSSYGPHTVSIKIVAVKHSLLIVAHEFGHVKYQVPNLAAYIDFFSRHYQGYHMKANYLGHKPNDPSGQSAIIFEKVFRKEYLRFVDDTSDKPQSPIIMLDQIAKAFK